MTHHSLDIRIYYEDTDAGGVVYHASYLNFAERGRTEFLRSLGHENAQLEKDEGILFVVKHIDIEYHKPAFLDDLLRLDTSIESIKNTSFIMRQTTYCPARANEKISEMRVAIVTVDTKSIKPVRLPEKIKTEFQSFIE